MSKSNALENAWLLLLFNNSNIANVGDATGLQGSGTAGSLYVGLHTADPGEAGDQTTSECAYGSYARVAVARSGSGWTVTSNQVENAALISFPAVTSGTETVLFASVGTASSGSGVLLYSAPLSDEAPIAAVAEASADTITIPGHTLSVDDRITFHALPGSTLPAGLSVGTVYYVKTVSSNDITISTTSGGAVVDITAAGSMLAQKVTPLSVSSGITPQFAPSAIVFTED